MKVMFVGTSSNAGKTLISALFCRYLRSKMIMVSPFKALNLSSRSFRIEGGGEIGIGQALQAWASDIMPSAKMNPILIKHAGGKLRTMANGVEKELDRDSMFQHILRSFDELCDMFDAVVIEGSGSPAEINLRDSDVANVNFAVSRKIPMVLVGDIQKGGVFAGIYGTWRLIGDEGRNLMKGFIINKYHGDIDILRSGIERIEGLTGMKCLGVLPYMDIALPEEDSSDDKECAYSDGDIDSFVSALDKILADSKGRMDMEWIVRIASE